MVSLPDGEKISKICLNFIRFDVIHERDRRTLHDHIDRACIASRGKKLPGIREFQGPLPSPPATGSGGVL